MSDTDQKITLSTLKPPVEVVKWAAETGDGSTVRLLDQTQLPTDTVFIDCCDTTELFDAIKRLSVRGAPAIGVAAAYGMVLAANECIAEQKNGCELSFAELLAKKGEYLKSCRPTAVNLAWAIDRVLKNCSSVEGATAAKAILTEARAIHHEDERMCLEIGHYASGFIEKCTGILTHCNAGALATAGIGTATAGMYVAHEKGHNFCVYCDETRPLLQGSRLTAWELARSGINAVVITDNMAAQVMKSHRVEMVITGADRIAANGDSANKIGTYALAILAKHHGVPFYIAAPQSTFDLTLKSGDDIPIEQRGAEEITAFFGRQTAPDAIGVYAPAFDVTPAELITAIITDKGVISPVTPEQIKKTLTS